MRSQIRQNLRIFGAGVRAQVIVDLARQHFSSEYELEGFYDDNSQLGKIGPADLPVLGPIERGLSELPGSGVHAFFALGTHKSWRNFEILHNLRSRNVPIANLISVE